MRPSQPSISMRRSPAPLSLHRSPPALSIHRSPPALSRHPSSHVALLLSALAGLSACNFPRPADVGDDTPPADDAGTDDGPGISDAPDAAPVDPRAIVHVSPTGDDGNDGVTAPVKTLKRAIQIASENVEIKAIDLAAGRYTAADGETYPYAIPPRLTLTGPDTGDAVLVGAGTEVGLSIFTGAIQNIQLEDFGVAITAIGTASLSNVSIKNSGLGVRGESTAKLAVHELSVTGAIGASPTDCQIGITLVGAAELSATKLTTRSLITTLVAKDTSTVDIANALVTKDARCFGSAFVIGTSKTFKLRESSIVGNGQGGILFNGALDTPTAATVVNTMMTGLATGVSGSAVVFEMIGGEISASKNSALVGTSGRWSLVDVTLTRNTGFAVLLQGASAQSKSILSLRGCTITNNSGGGVYLFSDTSADLGTDASPGRNLIRANTGVGVTVFDDNVTHVVAVGNTWNPGIQGADGSGTYSPPATVGGPVAEVAGNNFSINPGSSLRR